MKTLDLHQKIINISRIWINNGTEWSTTSFMKRQPCRGMIMVCWKLCCTNCLGKNIKEMVLLKHLPWVYSIWLLSKRTQSSTGNSVGIKSARLTLNPTIPQFLLTLQSCCHAWLCKINVKSIYTGQEETFWSTTFSNDNYSPMLRYQHGMKSGV